MKIEIKPVYQCDFCKKKLFVKGAMERHEFGCTYNPKNFSACINCKHCKTVDVDINVKIDEWDGYVCHTKKFHCDIFNKDMYPFRAVKKGLLERYPETFKNQELMPTACPNMQERVNEEFSI